MVKHIKIITVLLNYTASVTLRVCNTSTSPNVRSFSSINGKIIFLWVTNATTASRRPVFVYSRLEKSIVTEFPCTALTYGIGQAWHLQTHTHSGCWIRLCSPSFILPVSRWPTSFTILARETFFAKTAHAGNLAPPTQVSIWRRHRQRRNYPVTAVSRRTSFSHSATKLRAAGGPVALRRLSYHRC